jgi:hypothetical protein
MKKIPIVIAVLFVLIAFTTTALAVNPAVQKGQATGGGSIISRCDLTKLAKFSFTAADTKGVIKGDVEYKDLPCGIVLKGSVTGFLPTPPNEVELTGPATVNGQSGYMYVFLIEDNGAPGKRDLVSMEIFNSNGDSIYDNEGFLLNGNLKVVAPTA